MMDKSKVSPLPLLNQVLYASGSFAFTLLERLIILYAVFYYLPPKELGLHNLVPERTYFGFVTVTGTALLLGRVFDALADPVVASLSDNNRSRIGRRKLFLLLSALPFALFTFLVFTPPQPGQEALVNGAWLAALMCLFYIAFTAYVNPFLALMSELGHTNSLRINLSTFMAFFGLMGMVLITIFFPQVVALFKAGGMETRLAYRLAIGGFSLLALLILYLVTFSFDEKALPAGQTLRRGHAGVADQDFCRAPLSHLSRRRDVPAVRHERSHPGFNVLRRSHIPTGGKLYDGAGRDRYRRGAAQLSLCQ